MIPASSRRNGDEIMYDDGLDDADAGGVTTGRMPGFAVGATVATGGEAGVIASTGTAVATGGKAGVIASTGAIVSAAATFKALGLKGDEAIGGGVGPDSVGPGAGRGTPEVFSMVKAAANGPPASAPTQANSPVGSPSGSSDDTPAIFFGKSSCKWTNNFTSYPDRFSHGLPSRYFK